MYRIKILRVLICLSFLACSTVKKNSYQFDEIFNPISIIQIPDSMGISGIFSDFIINNDSLYYFIDVIAGRQIFKVNTKTKSTKRFGQLGNGPNEYTGATGINVQNDTIVVNDDLSRYIFFNQKGNIIGAKKVNNHIGQSQFLKVGYEYIGIKSAPVQHYLYSTKQGHIVERQKCFQFPTAVSGLDLVNIGRKLYFMNTAELKIYTYDLDSKNSSSFEIKGISGQQNWGALYDHPVNRKISLKMLKEGYWNTGFWKFKSNGENLLAITTFYNTIDNYLIILDLSGNIKAKIPSFIKNTEKSYRKNIIHIQDESIITFETDSIGDHYFGKYRLSKNII